jgi:hypothetical protein
LTNLLNNPDKGIISIQEILNDEYKKELILFDDSTNLI